MENTNLPPDPEQRNEIRASHAAVTLVLYGSSVRELIADLAHWCDRNGVSLWREIARAGKHYQRETDNQGEQFKWLS